MRSARRAAMKVILNGELIQDINLDEQTEKVQAPAGSDGRPSKTGRGEGTSAFRNSAAAITSRSATPSSRCSTNATWRRRQRRFRKLAAALKPTPLRASSCDRADLFQRDIDLFQRLSPKFEMLSRSSRSSATDR